MRSRTEMVTTTFVDSEEDYSDDDDSEEDWKPSASSKNCKKQKHQKCGGNASAKKGRKRKRTSARGNTKFKRKTASGDSDDDERSEDDCENGNYEPISGSSKYRVINLTPKKQPSDNNSSISSNDDSEYIFNLLVYVKDLTTADLNKSNSLCLWRKDNNNLLQKYIRVKTSPDEFLFTSSSVYSSFDDKRISDFYEIKVMSMDSTNRRVKVINPSHLHKICLKNIRSNYNDGIINDKKYDTREEQKIKSKKHFEKPVPNNKVAGDEEVEDEDSDVEGDDEDAIEEYDETEN